MGVTPIVIKHLTSQDLLQNQVENVQKFVKNFRLRLITFKLKHSITKHHSLPNYRSRNIILSQITDFMLIKFTTIICCEFLTGNEWNADLIKPDMISDLQNDHCKTIICILMTSSRQTVFGGKVNDLIFSINANLLISLFLSKKCLKLPQDNQKL